jgi:SAM-dependent methyltransferase
MDAQGTTDHWEEVFRSKAPGQVSWYESVPEISLALVAEASLPLDAAIVDVGGGASTLAARLLDAGYADITVVDIAASALERARAELGSAAQRIAWVCADVRTHRFPRRFALWHDRALFHFMVQDADIERYLDTLREALEPEGQLILATFGPEGPTRCSGLPTARYGEDRLGRVLGPQFMLRTARLGEHHTPWGAGQQFLYTRWQRERSQREFRLEST